jgi:hypothetical protein
MTGKKVVVASFEVLTHNFACKDRKKPKKIHSLQSLGQDLNLQPFKHEPLMYTTQPLHGYISNNSVKNLLLLLLLLLLLYYH